MSTYCVSVMVDGEILVYVSAENEEEAKGRKLPTKLVGWQNTKPI